jgi:hypothetical protein
VIRAYFAAEERYDTDDLVECFAHDAVVFGSVAEMGVQAGNQPETSTITSVVPAWLKIDTIPFAPTWASTMFGIV